MRTFLIKMVLAWVFLALFYPFLFSQAVASGPTTLLVDGIRQYREGQYAAAAASFQKVAGTGIANGDLYYNIGNAYLKVGDLGRAVLWYQRAARMIPTDPDLQFNLAYAHSQVRDRAEEEGPSISRILFFWRQLMSRSTAQWTAIFFNGLLWTILAIHLFMGRKSSNIATLALMGITMIFVLTVFFNHYEDHYVKKGVILPAQVSVRSGLSNSATELFILHAGSPVRVDRETGGFVRIFFAKGKIGWLPKKDVGVI